MTLIKETICQLETNIDHLTGEELGEALRILNDLPQTLDAIFIQAIGKKNRPCGILQVLCKPENELLVVEAVFRHTHTLGLRTSQIQRYIIPRHEACLPYENVPIKAKMYEIDSHEYLRPEADELSAEAKRKHIGMPALRMTKHVSYETE